MQTLMNIVTAAVLCEAIWELLKMFCQKGKFKIDRLGVLAVGIITAIIIKIDLFVIIGINISIPVIGYILTGIVMSRIANILHDIFIKISANKKSFEAAENKCCCDNNHVNIKKKNMKITFPDEVYTSEIPE